MPEYFAPGVYVEEIELSGKPIEGVSTSTVGFLGETERGPTNPKFIASWLDYQKLYGDFFGDNQYLPFAVKGFFDNGGKRCYIGRIVKTESTKASISLKEPGTSISALTVWSVGEGSWGNRIAVKVEPPSVKGFKITIFYWKSAGPDPVFDPTVDLKKMPRPSVTEMFDNVSVDSSSPDYYGVKVNGISNLIVLLSEIADSGRTPGNSSVAYLQGGNYPVVLEGIAVGGNTNKIDLEKTSASNVKDAYKNMWIEITEGIGKGQTRQITSYDKANQSATVDQVWGTAPSANGTRYQITNSGLGDYIVKDGGSARGGEPDKIYLADSASTIPDDYKDMWIEITGGLGKGQARRITAYDGTTRNATVAPVWDEEPTDESTYRIMKDLEFVLAGNVRNGTAISIRLAEFASATEGEYVDMLIEITDGTGKGQIRKIIAYNGGADHTATIDAEWGTVPESESFYRVTKGIDFIVSKGEVPVDGGAQSIQLDPNASNTTEAYTNMTIEITAGPGQGQLRKIAAYNGANQIATLDANWETDPTSASKYRIWDPNLTVADYTRDATQKPNRKGLTGFSEIDEISIVYAPHSESAVTGLTPELITHCERLKDRVAIIDAELGSVDISTLNPRAAFETKYAAFYYPWIKVVHPATGSKVLVPPGGHVAGIYARSDVERGVHKAPANEIVTGAVDVEFQITKPEQEMLNPRGVNVIRAFTGRGIRVWGARTLSSDPSWKYINVRRLFNYLEESIDEATQWVVFEPNNEKLWANVRRTVTAFLTRVWRDGALMGTKQEEAFFVKADRSTMTQDDIENGRLIVVIGVAPVKPAEFVIFRIAQVASGLDSIEA